jgi:malate/lactate dehydrogenase
VTPQTAFTGADAVIMLGAFPRKDGMERKDLLEKNCGIFKEQVCLCCARCARRVPAISGLCAR